MDGHFYRRLSLGTCYVYLSQSSFKWTGISTGGYAISPEQPCVAVLVQMDGHFYKKPLILLVLEWCRSPRSNGRAFLQRCIQYTNGKYDVAVLVQMDGHFYDQAKIVQTTFMSQSSFKWTGISTFFLCIGDESYLSRSPRSNGRAFLRPSKNSANYFYVAVLVQMDGHFYLFSLYWR